VQTKKCREVKYMSSIKDISDIDEFVDVIASGYEWICPIDETYHEEIEHTETVRCKKCKRIFKTNPPEHAYRT
jgi:hypothetical protein